MKSSPAKLLSLLLATILLATTPIAKVSAYSPIDDLTPEQRSLFRTSGIIFYDPTSSICNTTTLGKNFAIPNITTDVGSTDIRATGVTPGDENVETFIIETLRSVAQKLGVPEEDVITQEHVLGMMAFGWGEAGNIANGYTYNLYNSTQGGNGSIQRYPSFDAGVEYTARTIINPYQNRLAAVLQDRSSTATDFLFALTHYELYQGNLVWAIESKTDPAYFDNQMSYLTYVINNYAQVATTALGRGGNTKGTYTSDSGLHYTNILGEGSSGLPSNGSSSSSPLPSSYDQCLDYDPISLDPNFDPNNLPQQTIGGHKISQWFGANANNSNLGYGSKGHSGIDVAMPIGTTLYSVATGRVISTHSTCANNGYLGNTCGGKYGNNILLDIGNGFQLRYAHMSTVLVSPEDQVRPGQPIGTSGNSGNTSGAHLHFELIKDGQRVNPALYPEIAPYWNVG